MVSVKDFVWGTLFWLLCGAIYLVVMDLLLYPQRNSGLFAWPFLQTWMTTTLTSPNGGGTSAESSKSLWWKWVQALPSPHETESFPDLEWLHGEQTPCKGRRRQSWSPKQISVWYLNICEPFMHACLHYWVSAALRNIWPLPPVKLILLQEGHGYLWELWSWVWNLVNFSLANEKSMTV